MSDLLENLNPEQLAAVTLPARHALILAGAGSGKTRVLITRIAWLLHNAAATSQQILAVTFTNKAAREMQTRLEAMLPFAPRGMWIGTFHGLANRLLRTHHRDAGLPQLFQILDSADQLAAIKRLLKTLNEDPEKYPPRDLQHFINAHKEAGRRPHAISAEHEGERYRLALYQEYEAQCQREGVVDFAELLLRSLELLERHEVLRQHYQRRFRHVLVDEFQDTNPLQYRWLKLLAGVDREDGAAMFCVGDDDQSIYRFRGAEVGNMRDFERDFAGDQVIRLEQNYRSGGNILDAANALIRNNSERLGKNLWTAQGAGEPIRVYEAFADSDEARWIVEEVNSRIADGILRSDIALLYRANAQSRILEHQLFSAGIPYRVHGGLRFFERQEIKHALAYLRLLANPDDDTAFVRVVNFPTRGIGARSLEVLGEAAHRWQASLYDSVSHLSGKPRTVLGNFLTLIEDMRRDSEQLPLPELVEHVIINSGLAAHYEADKDGRERLDNLAELVNAANSFVASQQDAEAGAGELSGSPLADFLAHAALEAGDHQSGSDTDVVQLMTVHAAKGLEFNTVFVTGLEEGLFPHENSLFDPGGEEEERRLMYVALTRARERLYLSFAQSRMLHGQTRFHRRSHFFDELPAALLKWLSADSRSGGSGGGSAAAARPRQATTAAARPGRAAAARTPRSTAALPGGWQIGQNVRHPRFGTGVIIAAEGSASDAKLQIRFADVGTKWLLLSVARLEAL